VRLTSVSLELLRDVQRMLLNFGIASRIYKERYPEREVEIKGRTYQSREVHDLVIGRGNLLEFVEEVGFLTTVKQDTLISRLGECGGRGSYREKFTARFEALVPEGEEMVYDLTEPLTHSFAANGFVVHNCGEQPLASYTACNLGNLNLVKFVDQGGNLDFDALADATAVSTRFLDDVIEYNMDNHALSKIREAVSSDRRVGMGITGLADALVLMQLKYDSAEALEAVDKIMQTLCHNAYETSVELAREKGAFPLFEWEGLSRSKFIQGLPQSLRGKIEKFGLRNCTLITMPPVGTGSIVAETTSGIEPIFCTSYNRRVKQADGETFRDYKVYHPLIEEVFGDDENLPDYVVTAHQIDPFFRVKMQGVIQKYTDSSISSTINLAEDIAVETVADIYITAYEEGLKGVTVYREGSRQGILQTEDTQKKKEEEAQPEEPEEIAHGRHPRRRPAVTRGVTERIRTGEGKIYVTINEDEQGLCEVFSTIGKAGGNAAAQSEAISRLISLALRSDIDPQEIINELKGISGPNPVWENGELILSTPDAIGKAIERHLQRREEGRMVKAGEAVAAVPVASEGEFKTTITCPECGVSVMHESGCLTCKHCGWSKC
jgi:ribonucleoside-diphosphate reductase alpha chain